MVTRNGMFTAGGIRNLSYYAWYFLSLVGDEFCHLEPGIFVSRRDDTYVLLAYDWRCADAFSKGNTSTVLNELTTSLSITGPEGNYSLFRLKIDHEQSPIKNLNDLGYPKALSKEEIDFLNRT